MIKCQTPREPKNPNVTTGVIFARLSFVNPPSPNHALRRTDAALGSQLVRVICSRLLQPTGLFRRRSLNLVVRSFQN